MAGDNPSGSGKAAQESANARRGDRPPGGQRGDQAKPSDKQGNGQSGGAGKGDVAKTGGLAGGDKSKSVGVGGGDKSKPAGTGPPKGDAPKLTKTDRPAAAPSDGRRPKGDAPKLTKTEQAAAGSAGAGPPRGDAPRLTSPSDSKATQERVANPVSAEKVVQDTDNKLKNAGFPEGTVTGPKVEKPTRADKVFEHSFQKLFEQPKDQTKEPGDRKGTQEPGDGRWREQAMESPAQRDIPQKLDAIVDKIGSQAAELAAKDKEFRQHYDKGNMREAGSRFHTLAKDVARGMQAKGELLPGYEVVFAEKRVSAPDGKSYVQVDLLLKSPAGLHEVDWKRNVVSGLERKIVKPGTGEMARHKAAIEHERGAPLLTQESRSWEPMVKRSMTPPSPDAPPAAKPADVSPKVAPSPETPATKPGRTAPSPEAGAKPGQSPEVPPKVMPQEVGGPKSPEVQAPRIERINVGRLAGEIGVAGFGIAAGLLDSYVVGKVMDGQLADQFKRMQPELQAKVAGFDDQLAALRTQAPDKPIYAHVTIDVTTLYTMDDSGFPAGLPTLKPAAVVGADLKGVTLSHEPLREPRTSLAGWDSWNLERKTLTYAVRL